MRLNLDAIREVLIYIADNFGYVDNNLDPPYTHETLTIEIAAEGVLTKFSDAPSRFTKKELIYATEQLLEEQYLRTASPIVRGKCNSIEYALISDLTLKGHNLLTNLENEQIWNTVKSIANRRGGISFDVVTNVCGKLAMLAMTQPDALSNAEKAISTCFGALQ